MRISGHQWDFHSFIFTKLTRLFLEVPGKIIKVVENSEFYFNKCLHNS